MSEVLANNMYSILLTSWPILHAATKTDIVMDRSFHTLCMGIHVITLGLFMIILHYFIEA